VLLVVLLRRRPLLPDRAGTPLVLAAGIADITGAVLFLLASREGLLVLTSVLTSLYPAVTVLLAQIALRERLVRLQLGGMALAGAAVAMITLA
jgi:drug/metabolite transporter (DMT)-like permease